MPGDLYVPYLSRTIPGQTLRHLKWFVNVETIFDNLDLTVISIPLPQVIDSGWGLCKPLRTASHQLQNDSLHRDCVGQAHLQGFLLELGTGYLILPRSRTFSDVLGPFLSLLAFVAFVWVDDRVRHSREWWAWRSLPSKTQNWTSCCVILYHFNSMAHTAIPEIQ